MAQTEYERLENLITYTDEENNNSAKRLESFKRQLSKLSERDKAL